MSALETYECDGCGETFTAYPDSNAAENAHCSPACGADGRESEA